MAVNAAQFPHRMKRRGKIDVVLQKDTGITWIEHVGNKELLRKTKKNILILRIKETVESSKTQLGLENLTVITSRSLSNILK